MVDQSGEQTLGIGTDVPIHPPAQEVTAIKPWRNARRGCPPTRRPEPLGGVPKPWRRRARFGGFRRSFKRDHGCPAFVAEATSAEAAKAVGLHRGRVRTKKRPVVCLP
jgi:hypothetical protein